MIGSRETWDAIGTLCLFVAAGRYIGDPLSVMDWLWMGILILAIPRLKSWVESRKDKGSNADDGGWVDN